MSVKFDEKIGKVLCHGSFYAIVMRYEFCVYLKGALLWQTPSSSLEQTRNYLTNAKLHFRWISLFRAVVVCVVSIRGIKKTKAAIGRSILPRFLFEPQEKRTDCAAHWIKSTVLGYCPYWKVRQISCLIDEENTTSVQMLTFRSRHHKPGQVWASRISW